MRKIKFRRIRFKKIARVKSRPTPKRDAEVYAPGTEIEYGGVKHTVARDLGDSVELVTPEVSRPLRGGGALRIAAGNTVSVAKAGSWHWRSCDNNRFDDPHKQKESMG
jgi:hypothetical protein